MPAATGLSSPSYWFRSSYPAWYPVNQFFNSCHCTPWPPQLNSVIIFWQYHCMSDLQSSYEGKIFPSFFKKTVSFLVHFIIIPPPLLSICCFQLACVFPIWTPNTICSSLPANLSPDPSCREKERSCKPAFMVWWWESGFCFHSALVCLLYKTVLTCWKPTTLWLQFLYGCCYYRAVHVVCK